MQFPQRVLLLLVLLGTTFAAAAAAQTATISPSDRAQLEGSTFTHLPLGRHDARMQTLHLDLPGGTVLTGHAYRREAAGVYGGVAGFASDLEVSISMSPRTPATATSTFAANAGANATVVLPRRTVHFPATQRPPLDPAATFDLVIPYQVPFVLPPQGGTVCVDVRVFGNITTGGNDRNFHVYLDGHRCYPNGVVRQPGYRYGNGCTAPGGTAATYASMWLWNLGSDMQLDLALRHGIAADGSGLARVWVAFGDRPGAQPWPGMTQCTLHGSNDIWFLMPGAPTTTGHYDGNVGSLPLLPAGYRLWCQAGTAHLGTGALSFGDGVTLVTPPRGPQPIPACRIVNGSDHTAASGVVSNACPVMLFF